MAIKHTCKAFNSLSCTSRFPKYRVFFPRYVFLVRVSSLLNNWINNNNNKKKKTENNFPFLKEQYNHEQNWRAAEGPINLGVGDGWTIVVKRLRDCSLPLI